MNATLKLNKKEQKRRELKKQMKKYSASYLMIAPYMIIFFAFTDVFCIFFFFIRLFINISLYILIQLKNTVHRASLRLMQLINSLFHMLPLI